MCPVRAGGRIREADASRCRSTGDEACRRRTAAGAASTYERPAEALVWPSCAESMNIVPAVVVSSIDAVAFAARSAARLRGEVRRGRLSWSTHATRFPGRPARPASRGRDGRPHRRPTAEAEVLLRARSAGPAASRSPRAGLRRSPRTEPLRLWALGPAGSDRVGGFSL